LDCNIITVYGLLVFRDIVIIRALQANVPAFAAITERAFA